jgi:hypothetical protein
MKLQKISDQNPSTKRKPTKVLVDKQLIDDTQKKKIRDLFLLHRSSFKTLLGINTFKAFLRWVSNPLESRVLLNLCKEFSFNQLAAIEQETQGKNLELKDFLSVQRLRQGINKDLFKIATVDYYLNPSSAPKLINPDHLFSSKEIAEIDRQYPALPEPDPQPDPKPKPDRILPKAKSVTQDPLRELEAILEASQKELAKAVREERKKKSKKIQARLSFD